MQKEEMAFTPAWKQALLVARREVSPVELTTLYLERIERLDPVLHAYITVCADHALDAARRAEERAAAGGDLPPFLGVPVSVKDVEATRGIRTTLGSPAFRDHVPDEDSVVAERVRKSGAVLIGKNNTPELGVSDGQLTVNDLVGRCCNPWDVERTTGGSSGGAAAAIASGLCAIATGSDGGGSIRIPASFCGVYGIKATHGRVPRAGGFGKPEPNQFSQSGPVTRTVRDAAILLQALSGPDPRHPCPDSREDAPDFVTGLDREVAGLRIGWSSTFGYGVIDPAVEKVVSDAALVFETMGCNVEEANISLDTGLREHFWAVFSANKYAGSGELLETPDSGLAKHGRRVLEMGKAVTGARYASALRAVNQLKLDMAGIMAKYDLLLTPTASITAFRPDERPVAITGEPGATSESTGVYPCTFHANMTGQPAATVPCGFVDGLPVGLHVIGRRGDDALVLRASAAFERARPWAHVRPPVS